ncbi:hypothetical protein LINPERHAP1_LOCUS23631, partial [Linum perenne]
YPLSTQIPKISLPSPPNFLLLFFLQRRKPWNLKGKLPLHPDTKIPKILSTQPSSSSHPFTRCKVRSAQCYQLPPPRHSLPLQLDPRLSLPIVPLPWLITSPSEKMYDDGMRGDRRETPRQRRQR